MRIVVIGGTQFIGLALVRHLTERGHEVTVFHRGETEPPDLPAVAHIHGDLDHLADFSPMWTHLAPDVVVHMMLGMEAQAQEALRALRGATRRLVAISSMDVYRAHGRINRSEPGPPDPVPLTEDAPLRDHLYPYRGKVDHLHDYDKILVERVVLGDPVLPGTVLRLPMVHGPRDYQHWLLPYLKRMDDGRPSIVLDEDRARMRATRGYVENVAVAIALAAADARASGRIYNVGEADPLSEAEWVRSIGQAAGWTGEVLVVPRDQLPDTLRWDGDARQDFVADTTPIRAELGYCESVPRTEALRQTVVWERANPPAEVPPKMFDYAGEDAVLAAAFPTLYQ